MPRTQGSGLYSASPGPQTGLCRIITCFVLSPDQVTLFKCCHLGIIVA